MRALGADPADAELHELRKLGKRTRYAFELAGHRRAVQRAKELQDVLGEHQDAVVAEAQAPLARSRRAVGTGARGGTADRGRAAPARAGAGDVAEGMEAARARGDVTVVRAAGGLIRRSSDHGTEVLVVHRPRYDDWTFPKGKADDGETDEDCALREVDEETGLRCLLESPVGTTEYVDGKGRPKQVRWWVMRQLEDGGFVPNDEVDELRWVTLGDAARLLTYDRDVALLDRVR